MCNTLKSVNFTVWILVHWLMCGHEWWWVVRYQYLAFYTFIYPLWPVLHTNFYLYYDITLKVSYHHQSYSFNMLLTACQKVGHCFSPCFLPAHPNSVMDIPCWHKFGNMNEFCTHTACIKHSQSFHLWSTNVYKSTIYGIQENNNTGMEMLQTCQFPVRSLFVTYDTNYDLANRNMLYLHLHICCNHYLSFPFRSCRKNNIKDLNHLNPDSCPFKMVSYCNSPFLFRPESLALAFTLNILHLKACQSPLPFFPTAPLIQLQHTITFIVSILLWYA